MSQQGPGGQVSPEPSANKTNPLIYVAGGCAVLFVIVLGVIVAMSVVAWDAAKRGGVSAGGAFSAGVAVSIDGGVVSIDAGAVTGPSKGALGAGASVCEKAAECCRRAIEQTGGNAEALASCESLRTNAPEAGCQQAIETYRASPAFGTLCP